MAIFFMPNLLMHMMMMIKKALPMSSNKRAVWETVYKVKEGEKNWGSRPGEEKAGNHQLLEICVFSKEVDVRPSLENFRLGIPDISSQILSYLSSCTWICMHANPKQRNSKDIQINFWGVWWELNICWSPERVAKPTDQLNQPLCWLLFVYDIHNRCCHQAQTTLHSNFVSSISCSESQL